MRRTRRDESCFDAWLLKITYREAKNIKKKSHAYEDISELTDAFSYEPQTQDLEFFDILASSGLDQTSKLILTLKFMYGYTLEEISKTADLNLSTVKTKYYRSLDRLKKKLGYK